MVEAICMLILEEDAPRTRISSPHLSRYRYNIAFFPLILVKKIGHFGFYHDDTSPLFCLWQGKYKVAWKCPPSTLRYDHFCSTKSSDLFMFTQKSPVHIGTIRVLATSSSLISADTQCSGASAVLPTLTLAHVVRSTSFINSRSSNIIGPTINWPPWVYLRDVIFCVIGKGGFGWFMNQEMLANFWAHLCNLRSLNIFPLLLLTTCVWGLSVHQTLQLIEIPR